VVFEYVFVSLYFVGMYVFLVLRVFLCGVCVMGVECVVRM